MLAKKLANIRTIMFALFLLIIAACGGNEGERAGSADVGLAEPVVPGSPEPEEGPPEESEPRVITRQINWGDEQQQFAELYTLAGRSELSPVVVMIHGGCWQSGYTLNLQGELSQALAERGLAVWNIEYRSLGNGGEWPVMFQDVAAAIDYLPQIAVQYQLDLDSLVTMGHSAGGHLALWLASRNNIDTNSVLFNDNPTAIRGVITLGGIGNLESPSCSGSARQIIDRANISEEELQYRLENTSPIHMLPTSVKSLLISGNNDVIVPPEVSQEYVDAALLAGDFSEHLIIEGASHFYLIDRESMDITLLVDSVESFLAPNNAN